MLLSELSREMWQTGEDAKHLGRTLCCPVVMYRLEQILCCSPGGCEVPGTDDLLWCGRLASLTGRTLNGETRPCRASSFVRVIMMIICVRVVELLCQAVMGHAPVLKCHVLGVHGCLCLCPIMLVLIRHCFCKVPTVVVFTRYWRAPECD
jgi:hypothetical protein